MRLTRFPLLYTWGVSMLLLSMLIVTGCGISQPSAISTQLLSSPWQSISAPGGLPVLAYTVSPDDPATLYACTLDKTGDGLVWLWRTRDAGSDWSRLPVPATAGSDCQVNVDPVQAQFVVLDVTNHSIESRPCDGETFYLSTDSGDSWQRVPYIARGPLNPTFSLCNMQIVASSLYLWSSYAFPTQGQVSVLERSDDEGVHWTRVDAPFGGKSVFNPPQITDNGKTLLVSVLSAQSPSPLHSSSLWISHDAGQSWQLVGAVPGSTMLLAADDQAARGTLLYNMAEEQLPEAFYYLQVYQSADEHLWSALPPLPAPGTSPGHPGLLQTLAVTTDGRLLAFGVDPFRGLPSHTAAAPVSRISAFWLWLWNPSQERWQVFSLPLAYAASESCGLCWRASLATGVDHTTYLTVAHLDNIDDSSSGYHLFRVQIPGA